MGDAAESSHSFCTELSPDQLTRRIGRQPSMKARDDRGGVSSRRKEPSWWKGVHGALVTTPGSAVSCLSGDVWSGRLGIWLWRGRRARMTRNAGLRVEVRPAMSGRDRVRDRAVRPAATSRHSSRRGDRRGGWQTAASQNQEQARGTGRHHHPGWRRRPDPCLPALGGRQSRAFGDPRHQESRRRSRRTSRERAEARARRRTAEDGRERLLRPAAAVPELLV